MLKNLKRVYVLNEIGCILRDTDAQRIKTYFRLNGSILCNTTEEAEIVILITCGVVKKSEDFSYSKLDVLVNSEKVVIFMGCVPEQSPNRLSSYNHQQNLFIVSTKNISDLDNIFPWFKIKFDNVPLPNFISDRMDLLDFYKKVYNVKLKFINIKKSLNIRTFKNIFQNFKLKVINKNKIPILRISNGCNQNCNFCTVRTAVGKLRSRNLADIIEEYKKLYQANFAYIALNADDTGSYGTDINITFEDLLNELYSISSTKVSIIIDELNPVWFVKYENAIKKYVKCGFIRRIIIPIQSASEIVLKSMNRYSNINNIARIIKELVELNPSISFGTYILLNYPTETEDEFLETISFLKISHFDTIWFIFYHVNDSDCYLDENIKNKRIEIINKTFYNKNITFDIC